MYVYIHYPSERAVLPLMKHIQMTRFYDFTIAIQFPASLWTLFYQIVYFSTPCICKTILVIKGDSMENWRHVALQRNQILRW